MKYPNMGLCLDPCVDLNKDNSKADDEDESD